MGARYSLFVLYKKIQKKESRIEILTFESITL